jgi:peroxiredoxin
MSFNQNNGYTIKGDVTGFPNNTLISLTDISGQITIDSTYITDGKFEFKGVLNDVPKILRLQSIVESQFIYTTLFIGNDEIKITGDIKDFPYDVQIEGSRTQQNLNRLIELTKPYFKENQLLVKGFMDMTNDEKMKESTSFNQKLKKIHKKLDSIEVDYIKSNLNTYVAVMYLDMKKTTLPKGTVEDLYNKLSIGLKTSDFAKPIRTFLNVKIADVGDIAHEIEAFDKNMELVKLSNLRGKYVLLDFMATGCAPCVNSLDDLKEINKSFNDSLTIFSYSQDANKSIWLNTMKKYEYTWLNVWDGTGGSGDVSTKYGINSIPAFFLINPEGVIIEKWRGFAGKGTLLKRLERFKNK